MQLIYTILGALLIVTGTVSLNLQGEPLRTSPLDFTSLFQFVLIFHGLYYAVTNLSHSKMMNVVIIAFSFVSAMAAPGAFFSTNSTLQQFLTGVITCRYIIIIGRIKRQEKGCITLCLLEFFGSIPYIGLLMAPDFFNLSIVWVSGLLYDQLSPFLYHAIIKRLYIREVQTTLARSTFQLSSTRCVNYLIQYCNGGR
jgi:hypothetical protein